MPFIITEPTEWGAESRRHHVERRLSAAGGPTPLAPLCEPGMSTVAEITEAGDEVPILVLSAQDARTIHSTLGATPERGISERAELAA